MNEIEKFYKSYFAVHGRSIIEEYVANWFVINVYGLIPLTRIEVIYTSYSRQLNK